MATPPVSREAVLEQLERLRSSRAFEGAARSVALLTYVVHEAIEGRSERLKEYTLGAEALERGPSFDPRTDPIVRAEASRLRRRLDQYYASAGTGDPVVVTLPKGSYVPRFEARVAPPVPRPGRSPQRASHGSFGPLQKAAWFALGALTVGGGLAFSRRVLDPPTPAPRLVALTALAGTEIAPSFSPDGRSVAFGWAREDAEGSPASHDHDIYLKMVGSSELLQLTSGPAFDSVPAWSPDGVTIAFLRAESIISPAAAIHLVSPLGGPARKLADWPAAPRGALSWTRDGRALAVARAGSPSETALSARAIYLVRLDGGEPRALTAARGEGSDRAPALSPDGRHLAYASCETRLSTSCDIHVLDLGPGLVPVGAARRLTRQGLYSVHRIAWTSDGASLVYDTEIGPDTFFLWRVPADGTRPPERVEIAGVRAWFPAIAGSRLAFTRWLADPDIVRFGAGAAAQVFAASTYWEGSARFSPDGRRVVFESMRSGERQEIWLANADGGDPRQLTRGPGRMQGSPAWSPDGRRVAFDSLGQDGHWDIWSVDVDASSPVRLTRDAGDENVPSYSRDGRWVYFSARRGHEAGVFRLPSDGGAAEERVLSLESGSLVTAEESADGRLLLYSSFGQGPLFAHPLGGGARRTLAPCVAGVPRGFASSNTGVYYAACDDDWNPELHVVDPGGGSDRVLGRLERYRGHLGVSPDGGSVLYSTTRRTGADLVLVENFR